MKKTKKTHRMLGLADVVCADVAGDEDGNSSTGSSFGSTFCTTGLALACGAAAADENIEAAEVFTT